MFFVGLMQRRLAQNLCHHKNVPKKYYCEAKNKNFVLFGGGLGKLQGGLKEEEYFSSVNQGLLSKIRDHLDKCKNSAYLQNWDEFQKTLDHAALYNTTCMNKHKNIMEEVFFMNETADCFKILNDRVQAEPTPNPAEGDELLDKEMES